MALITEDGTGKADAESYCSVADATAFFAKRNKSDDWGAVTDQEASLRAATDYVEQTYRGRWLGTRKTSTQALDWPRYNVDWPDSPAEIRPDGVIPQELKNAVAELALKADAGELTSDLGRETLSETVDVISVTYAPGGARQTHYASVNGWIRSLLRSGGGQTRLVRS